MDRPMIFSAPMVRALLDGRKTQTRRVLKPQPNRLNGGHPLYDGRGSYSTDAGWKRLPYAVGDRLWVREAWFDPLVDGARLLYAADNSPDVGPVHRKRPSIHMPRWASRLTLTVTDVRVQRLQEISEKDARAEGVLWVPGHGEITLDELRCDPGYSNYLCCRQGFEVLWGSIHGDSAWDANPWVVALTFTVERRNIDAKEP